jgi:hypothetical protein
MYKEDDFDYIWGPGILRRKSIKLRASRLEQVDLPSVFRTEVYNILGERKVDATMADHLVTRGQTRF